MHYGRALLLLASPPNKSIQSSRKLLRRRAHHLGTTAIPYFPSSQQRAEEHGDGNGPGFHLHPPYHTPRNSQVEDVSSQPAHQHLGPARHGPPPDDTHLLPLPNDSPQLLPLAVEVPVIVLITPASLLLLPTSSSFIHFRFHRRLLGPLLLLTTRRMEMVPLGRRRSHDEDPRGPHHGRGHGKHQREEPEPLRLEVKPRGPRLAPRRKALDAQRVRQPRRFEEEVHAVEGAAEDVEIGLEDGAAAVGSVGVSM